MATTQIERVIPLKEAASRMGISVAALTRLVSDGMIRAVQLPDGSMAVSEQETARSAVNRKQFDELRGQSITISQAASKYHVPGPTIRNWIKHRYIAILGSGYPMHLDEADVTYCSRVYQERKVELGGSLVGARLFDESGLPYELRYPDVADYRRRKKRAKRTGSSRAEAADGR